VTDRDLVQSGDFITVDFEGTINGQPFAGNKGENYSLEVGGGHALPQFEEAMVGLKVNQRQNVHVSYPEDYPNKEIAGKGVDFSLAVREIKQKVLPPLDDEFAKDHGECATLDELKERLRRRLEEELRRYQEEDLKEKIVSQLIEAHAVATPPSMVERQTRYLMERYQNQVAGRESGSPPPMEEARKTLEARALRQVQATLLMERIAQCEKIEVADKEIQGRIDALARAAGDRAKAVRQIYSRPEAREDLRAQMVFDRTVEFLLENAKIKDIDQPPSKVDEQTEKS
jgi:trigger factor